MFKQFVFFFSRVCIWREGQQLIKQRLSPHRFPPHNPFTGFLGRAEQKQLFVGEILATFSQVSWWNSCNFCFLYSAKRFVPISPLNIFFPLQFFQAQSLTSSTERYELAPKCKLSRSLGIRSCAAFYEVEALRSCFFFVLEYFSFFKLKYKLHLLNDMSRVFGKIASTGTFIFVFPLCIFCLELYFFFI